MPIQKKSGNLFKDPRTMWYMHKPESVRENEMQKILWDFKILTDHLMSAGGSHLDPPPKKENLPNSEL